MCRRVRRDEVSPSHPPLFSRVPLRGTRQPPYLSAVTSHAPPLAATRFVLAGAGRVGSSLARWLAARGAQPIAIAGRADSESARSLAAELGCPVETLAALACDDADLLLLALPDGEIAAATEELARRPQARVVLHVAGALGAGVLAPLRARGSSVGAWHPLRAFPAPSRQVDEAADTFFALDGDPEAQELGRRLAQALGGSAGEVPESARALYHFAATLAAGGVTTLLATVVALADSLGLPEEARAGYLELARGALAAARDAADPADAITGPVARGDVDTFVAQLDALREADAELVPLAIELARETLRQVARRAAPTPAQRALAERLGGPELLDRSKDRVLTSCSEP